MTATSDPSTQKVLAGLVERVTFHDAENGFWVLRARARGHRDLVTVVGHAAIVSAGDWITASGEWVSATAVRFRKRSPSSSETAVDCVIGGRLISLWRPSWGRPLGHITS
jgi:exodeoxyribonuclease V alpha subunit